MRKKSSGGGIWAAASVFSKNFAAAACASWIRRPLHIPVWWARIGGRRLCDGSGAGGFGLKCGGFGNGSGYGWVG
ncbi:hypothetical protein C2S52_010834 [Perilla frutescens var. hirtella]|nr:hypothetical protein C2S52_010834 [Perilla frutescens var. hirtella]KAH6817646.1 hypothetical protein C2S51_001249 [Perilla frutescens var. frutescens]